MMRGYNSTITRKMKNCSSCGKLCYIYSKGRCEQCARVENARKSFEKEEQKYVEEKGLKDLILDADTIMSLYVRLKAADENGWVKCYTCPAVLKWNQIEHGHFMKRAHLRLRLDERNGRPQCHRCNNELKGNLKVYRMNLEIESPGVVDFLEEEAALVYHPTRDEIRQIISELTKKVNLFKKQKCL